MSYVDRKMRALSQVGVLALLTAAAASGAPAPLETTRVVFIELPVVVRDASGAATGGLPADRFAVIEGAVPQKIVRFEEVEPTALVLLLDVSGSMEARFWSARRTAWDLLEAVAPETPVAVLGCGGDSVPPARWAAGHEAAQRRLAGLLQGAADETPLVACLEAAAALLESSPLPGATVVAVSDGEETLVRGAERDAALERLEERLRARRARFEVLGYGRPGWMADLARATGGSWRSPTEGRGAVDELARRLSRHYEIGYYPAHPTPGWRPVRVDVRGAGLRVDAPRRYFLPHSTPPRLED